MTDDVTRRRRVQPNPPDKPKKAERRVRAEALPGDSIEYGLTYEVMIERGLKVWLKAGGTFTVQADETGNEAWDRITTFVDQRMEKLIEEHANNA